MNQLQSQTDLQPTRAYVPLAINCRTTAEDYDATVTGEDRAGSFQPGTLVGRRFGQYVLTEKLRVGGMGVVYEAEHLLLKRPCAVKLIKPGTPLDTATVERFEREVRAAARLTHWNSVQVFDYGCTRDGMLYYVMELLPGLDLNELVKRYGPLAPERTVHFLSQACGALHEAHLIGLVHRDIKPGNIFAAHRGETYDVAKLLDFGLVRNLIEEGEEDDTRSTQAPGFSGSPLYMSPEQATGFDLADQRSDVYSLGAVAYYLLTGAPPFSGDSAMDVVAAHTQAEVLPPSELRADTPQDLQDIVLRCLAKEPSKRICSAENLARALRACQSAGKWTQQHAAAWWEGIVC